MALWRTLGGPIARASTGIGRSLHVRPFSASVGVLKETEGERRVSIVPSIAEKFIKDGYTISVEKGAGDLAGFSDAQYVAAGCKMASREQVAEASKVVFSINTPESSLLPALKDKFLISWVGRKLPEGVEFIKEANQHNVTLMDTTAVPRISIAQKLDVLSSQAKLAGHRAVIEAAHSFGRLFAGEMTAAGKYPPAHTFVLGVGVAGLQSIGSAKSLGSVVRAWDVRDISDQVASMGGSWVTVDFKEDASAAGGYAKEASAAFMDAQRDTFHKHAKECDIIITTAAIPGRKSPVLITADMVRDMKRGSVIVDLAAAGGGNCELTKAGESFTTENGITIIGYTDLPARFGNQASSMYATNMHNLMKHVAPDSGKVFSDIDAMLADETSDLVLRSIVCCRNGTELVMPPPPMIPTAPTKAAPEVKEPPKDPNEVSHAITMGRAKNVSLGAAGFVGLNAVCADPVFTSTVTTFALAGAAGYQTVWSVVPSLHTPLMSVTCAISGISASGGMLLLGGSLVPHTFPQGLAAAAVVTSTINIVGGFMITHRMLDMFKRPTDPDEYLHLYAAPAAVLAGAYLVPTVMGFPQMDKLTYAYSSLLMLGAIAGLSNQQSARFGNTLGMIGVSGGLVATTGLMEYNPIVMGQCVGMLGVGSAIGYGLGKTVAPFQLPQMIAAFGSFGSLAASLTCIASYSIFPDAGAVHSGSAMLGDFVGGLTFTGSLVAFGKLHAILPSKALNLPGKNFINLGMLGAQAGIASVFLNTTSPATGVACMWATFGLSGLLGVHFIASVGGGDMPVCITVLNCYTGWALAAEGFMLNNVMLTAVGSLIGSSGAILTYIMCKAMNRDILNVLLGGYNTVAPSASKGDVGPREHREITVEGVADLVAASKTVIVVPGYGMAVAQAQGAVADLFQQLHAAGIKTRFGIHPVAGRMPGQMNVLLAEAGVPYDVVCEMDELNADFANTDLALVVGANDITNSAAVDDPTSPLAGMPVLRVWDAKSVIFMKRSMAAGYADIDNPVFFKEQTQMFLGDAKEQMLKVTGKVREILV